MTDPDDIRDLVSIEFIREWGISAELAAYHRDSGVDPAFIRERMRRLIRDCEDATPETPLFLATRALEEIAAGRCPSFHHRDDLRELLAAMRAARTVILAELTKRDTEEH
ncbi:hypothetical protein [Candidatus Methylocalor cossyra]|uniref:Uncharacterized protein n=1 Tax=Candidatus Methylocalor cossyra TaxID=3108543 RepID=A0ABM9NMQ0_9GAMM